MFSTHATHGGSASPDHLQFPLISLRDDRLQKRLLHNKLLVSPMGVIRFSIINNLSGSSLLRPQRPQLRRSIRAWIDIATRVLPGFVQSEENTLERYPVVVVHVKLLPCQPLFEALFQAIGRCCIRLASTCNRVSYSPALQPYLLLQRGRFSSMCR